MDHRYFYGTQYSDRLLSGDDKRGLWRCGSVFIIDPEREPASGLYENRGLMRCELYL